EYSRPIGSAVLARRLEERGIGITEDAVRYHLRVLDRQGCTKRLGNRGRAITEDGWNELHSSFVDTRLGIGLASQEGLAQQVSMERAAGGRRVAVSLSIVPTESLGVVLRNAAVACRAGITLSDRVALVMGGERSGGFPIPPEKTGLITVSTATIDGILLSRGLHFRPTFGGLVEVSGWRPLRIVDAIDFGYSSRDPEEILIRFASTRIRSIAENGHGLLLADVREMIGICRETVLHVLQEIRRSDGLGVVCAVGQVGQPLLGVPVRPHTFAVAIVSGLNPLVASYEAGVPVEFVTNVAMVDRGALSPVESFLPEGERDNLPTGGALESSWSTDGDESSSTAPSGGQ
ncbi:MAG: NrpR regulatory domain-containing protein, partial [Actinobacteria bacterium]|nr:NrpR regulatory domain-containing protein [Actinomycetota bacterium]